MGPAHHRLKPVPTIRAPSRAKKPLAAAPIFIVLPSNDRRSQAYGAWRSPVREKQATRRNRWRSRLARCVRHTLLGVLITVVLGFFCAWLKWDRTYGGWTIRESARGTTKWPGTVPENWPRTPAATTHLWRSTRVAQGMLIHDRAVYHKLNDPRFPKSSFRVFTYKVCAFGWPFPSLRFDVAEEEITYPGSHFIRVDYMNVASFPLRGMEIPHGSKNPICVLPLVPYWRGFAVNVVFWAGVSAFLPRAARAIGRTRGARRVARGECPRCRYPIGATSICSECGTDLSLTRPSLRGMSRGWY